MATCDQATSDSKDPDDSAVHTLLVKLSHIPITPFLVQEYAQLLQQYLLTVNHLSSCKGYMKVLSQLVCVAISQNLLDEPTQVEVHRLERIMVGIQYASLAPSSVPWWRKWFHARRNPQRRYCDSELWDCWTSPKDALQSAASTAFVHLMQLLKPQPEPESVPLDPVHLIPDPTASENPSPRSVNFFGGAQVILDRGATMNNIVSGIHYCARSA
ncbi:hypothetical protein AX16_006112 [Volvariella volvacea WC 439]|nr:hypothetical protein AX16_006112 [Volvariella volvacea WC 439]